ncbi:MAG TPA: lysylphosphatidylglycerol synthase transmembrane domain-containing protein [Gemmatimonadaceae bacterium]|nr:lysylphosphatidylglycerol synthase transmembrane domain-containing protein [Gemmatimonadaceae bacterium]
MTPRISWRAGIGLALSVLLLWVAFRDVRWSEVLTAVRGANILLVVLAVLVGNSMFVLRAIRWRPILAPVAPGLPIGTLWRATAIGMMANNLLPARMGELVRAFALSRSTTVPFSAAFASLVVDRVFDAVIVLLLLVVSLFDASFPASTLILGRPIANWAGSGVIALVVISLAIYAIIAFPDRLIGLFELFARRVAPRFEERGRVMLRSFADGLSVFRHFGHFLAVFLWAVAHWLVQALAFWIMFRALGINASFFAALFVQGAIVLLVSIPSTPGFFGPFEIASVAGLHLYGVPESLAAAWALSYHILSLIPITVFGLYYLARSGLHLGDLRELRQ